MDWSQILDWNQYVKLLVGLFAVVDPLASVPVFLALVQGYSAPDRQRVIRASVLTFLATLLLFTFFGNNILGLFAIHIDSLQIAGGLLILLMALDMLRGGEAEPADTADATPRQADISVGIVPLAIPFLAGPGAITTILIFANAYDYVGHRVVVAVVIGTVAVLIALILRMAPMINRVVGGTGMSVFHRVMGLIVAAIAVEFIIAGLAAHFPSLVH